MRRSIPSASRPSEAREILGYSRDKPFVESPAETSCGGFCATWGHRTSDLDLTP
jgi:hypothetical protein